MAGESDFSKLMDTILSIPGMNEMVKMDFRISRKNALLLSSVIERGLATKDGDKSLSLLSVVPPDSLKELSTIAADCLNKAGLMELSEKLKSFG